MNMNQKRKHGLLTGWVLPGLFSAMAVSSSRVWWHFPAIWLLMIGIVVYIVAWMVPRLTGLGLLAVLIAIVIFVGGTQKPYPRYYQETFPGRISTMIGQSLTHVLPGAVLGPFGPFCVALQFMALDYGEEQHSKQTPK